MVSQITKDFQRKSKLRKLADGGSPNPSMLGTGTAARAGGLLAGRGRQIDAAVDAAAGAPAPAPQRVAQAPKKSGLRSMFGFADGGSLRPEDITGGTATSIFTPGEMKQFNAMGSAAMASGNAEAAQAVGAGRAEAAQAAAAAAKEAAQFRGFADGGYNANRYQQSQPRDGGRVKGPGGRTDDKVGPVMLSDEEYVLPGDTADAIGRDKLDAIRLATHEFKDERKESALRGRTDDVPVDHLYDGGSPWVVDPKGTVRTNSSGGGYQWTVDPKGTVRPNASAGPGYQQPRALPPPQGSTAVGPARTLRRPPIDMGMAEVVEPAGKATRVGSALRGAVRGTAPAAGIAGAVQSFVDQSTGYRDHLQNSVDVKSPLGSVAADAVGVLSNVGDAALFGLPGRIGRGLAGIGYEGFVNGFLSPSDRDKYLQQRTQQTVDAPKPAKGPAKGPAAAASPTPAPRSDQGPAQPVVPASYQSRRLSEMGVPLDVQNSKPVVDSVTGNTRDFLRTGGTGQYQNLGTYGGDGNIYGKADNPSRPGRINNFVGVGAGANPSNEVGNTVQSPAGAVITSALRGLGSGPSAPGGSNYDGDDRSRETNDRYDKLAKELRGMYSAEGQGNLARRLLELEQLRANEQGNIRTNDASRANAQLTADTSRGNAELNARTNMLETLARMETGRDGLAAQAQAAQRKVVEDARRISEERDADSVKVSESVADSFAAGDKEKAQYYREVLSTLGPEYDQLAQGLANTDKRAFYTNILRQQIGRDEGLVLGRNVEATAQNAALGGIAGRVFLRGNGAAGKAVDTALGKIPRIGPVFSALRPVENLTRFGTLIGAGTGAMVTPEVKEYKRYDPIARDPVSGAALPARKDLREGFTYGFRNTYLNPFNDDVQTVSGRRTNRPDPTEEEAARRYRATLRTEK